MRRELAAILILLGALVLVAITAISVAYLKQASRVDNLEEENARIMSDHVAIGKEFVQQSQKLDRAVRAARTSYRQGFLAGRKGKPRRKLAPLPASIRALEPYTKRGFLVPRTIPQRLQRDERPRISTSGSGYTLRWPLVGVFASRQEALGFWTKQGWPGGRRTITIGSHRAQRLAAPTGIIYAWRERGSTYAVLLSQDLDQAGLSLIASMR